MAVPPKDSKRGEPPELHANAAIRSLCAGRLKSPLETRDYAVIDNVLSDDAVGRLAADLAKLRVSQGQGAHTETHAAGRRTDNVYYLNEHEAGERGLVGLLEGMRAIKSVGAEVAASLADSCGPLALPKNVQAACYLGDGGFYTKHTDNMPKDLASVTHWPARLIDQLSAIELRSWRAFTILLYANHAWRPPHQGCLRVHHEQDQGGGYSDIEPIGGRCVIFNSLLAHEVRPARERERWALTLWVLREDGDESKFLLS